MSKALSSMNPKEREAAITRRLKADTSNASGIHDESLPRGLGYWAARDSRKYTLPVVPASPHPIS